MFCSRGINYRPYVNNHRVVNACARGWRRRRVRPFARGVIAGRFLVGDGGLSARSRGMRIVSRRQTSSPTTRNTNVLIPGNNSSVVFLSLLHHSIKLPNAFSIAFLHWFSKRQEIILYKQTTNKMHTNILISNVIVKRNGPCSRRQCSAYYTAVSPRDIWQSVSCPRRKLPRFRRRRPGDTQ